MDGTNEWELYDLYTEAEKEAKGNKEKTEQIFEKKVKKWKHKNNLDEYQFNGGS